MNPQPHYQEQAIDARALRCTRMGSLPVLLGILLLCLSSSAAAATYGYAQIPLAWVNNGSHTAVVWGGASRCSGGWNSSPVDDDISAPIDIGFSYTYGATGYNYLQIMSNGRLQFVTAANSTSYCGYGTVVIGPPPTYPYNFPDGNMNNTMRVYGADFCPAGAARAECGGRVTYKLYGPADGYPVGSRMFVVTWSQMREWNSGSSLFNVQMILYETGDFVYQYKNIANASQGGGQIGYQLSAADYLVVDMTTVNSLAYSGLRFFKPTAPYAEYRLDECSGTTTTDVSGNNHHGTLIGGVSLGSPGRICTAFSLDGNNDYIALPSSFPKLGSTSGYTNFTIAAWINSSDAAKPNQRIYVDDQNNNGGFAVSLGDGGAGMVRFFSRVVDPVSFDSPSVVTSNNWYFVVATHDATVRKRRLIIYDTGGSLVSDSSDTYNGAWGSDVGDAAIGGENSAATESSGDFRFVGRLDETRIYNRVLADTEIAAVSANERIGLQRDGSLRACQVCGASLGNYNAFDSSTASGAVSGVIRSKIAGKTFAASTGNIDVVSLSGSALSAFTGNTTVQFLDTHDNSGTLDAKGCRSSWTPITTDTGLAAFTLAFSGQNRLPLPSITPLNAWPEVRLKIIKATDATLYGCSNDAFAIRPNHIDSVGAPTQDADWQTAGTTRALNNFSASGGTVHAAGKPFSLAGLTAKNAAGATTTNYAGTPSMVPGNVILPDPDFCAANGHDCVPGIFSAGSAFSSGALTSSAATYSEVGSFSWEVEDRTFADVDKADSTKLERYFRSNALIYTGRFVPDHFDTFVNEACGTFTYSGQPFALTIKARNAAGDTTLNYISGSLAKNVTLSDANGTAGTFKPSNPLLASVFGSGGVADLSTMPSVNFTFNTKLSAPATITVRAKDEDTLNLTPAGGTAVEGSLALLRSGRLRLLNAYGSELLDIRVPLRVESYTGTGWNINTADICTLVPDSAYAISSALIPAPSIKSAPAMNLGQGVVIFNKTSTAGFFDLAANLNAAGVDSSCNTAHGGTAANLPWLQGYWSAPANCGGVAAWSQDPAARIRLGSPKSPYIYLRERY